MEELTAKSNPSPSPMPLPLMVRFSLLALLAINKLARRRDGTVNRRLLNFFNIKAPASPKPIKGVKTYDVTVDPSRNLWFRIFDPTQYAQMDLPVVVFFHGGAFTMLSPDSKYYDVVCRKFAAQIPAVVVSVNYRLSPEHGYPVQYNDGFDVLKFLDGDNDGRKVLPENANISACFLAGDSAGGNIAHHVGKRASESEFGKLKVIGLVVIQPFFGGEERTECEKKMKNPFLVTLDGTDWAWKSFMPLGDRDHEVINVSGPRAADISRIKDFPASIVFVGGLDLLQDWQKRYYEWLKKSGKEAYLVEYPNMIHAFYLFPEFPESTKLLLEVKEFVHKQRQKKIVSDY